MPNQEVIIKVNADGTNVEFDAQGFTSGKCEDIMKSAMSLAGEIEEKKRKPEFYTEGHGGVKTEH